MGLDQTAYTKDKEGNAEEIQYWRKHNALDGWMESLWRDKGNTGEWNCSEVELTASDIDALETIVNDNALPETIGFFYGNDTRCDEWQKEETLNFISKAKDLLTERKKIYYSCWF